MRACLVHRLTILNILKLLFAFSVFSRKLKREEHLLYQSPLDLMIQSFRGLSVVKMIGWQIVGHVTLWPLQDDWYELGTLWVDPAVRKHGVGDEIMVALLKQRSDLHVLMTTTNPIVKDMGKKLGMSAVSFFEVNQAVHRATCVCDATKTGTGDYLTCQKKDGACSLFVRES